MTINVQTPEVYHVGNGSSTVFGVPFPFVLPSDLLVGLVTGGVETPIGFLTTGGNYAPGTIDTGAAPGVGVLVHIRRRTSLDQLTDYISNDGFPAQATERGLDKIVMALQDSVHRIGLLESGAAAEGLSTANVGGGVPILLPAVGGQVQAKTLLPGSGISYVETGTTIEINAAAGAGALLIANNLSDVANVATTRSNLGLGTAALASAASFLAVSSNLTDVASRQVSLNNLTAVGAATNEHVLTKDTGSGNAIWKAVPGGGGGEVNSGENVGGGTGIWKDKPALNLRFKSLAVDSTITQTVGTDDITHAINQAAPLAWTALEKFHGATAVPALGSVGFTDNANMISNASTYISRTATSPGVVETRAALLMHLHVPAGALGFEWGLTGLLDDSSNAGENTPLYMKAYKRGNASIWGGVFEVHRKGGSNAVNMYGLEVSLQTDGTNTGGQTAGVAFFYGPDTTGASTASLVPFGFLVKNFGGEPNAVVGTAFKAEGKANYVVADGTTLGTGVTGVSFANATGTYSSAAYDAAFVSSSIAAFRARSGQPIRLSGTDGTAQDLVYNATDSRMEFQRAGTWRFGIPTGATHDCAWSFKTSATNFYSGAFVPTWNGAIAVKADTTIVYVPTCSNHPP